MIALVVLAEPIATVLYQRGLFTHAEVLETRGAVIWMALGICSIALVRQSVPVFYALENTKTPVLMSLANLAVFGSTAIPLKALFCHRGLCMALILAALAQGFGLAGLLHQRLGIMGFRSVFSAWLRMPTAAIVSSAAAYVVSKLGFWERGGNSARNLIVLIAAIICGICVYGLVTHMLRITEATILPRAILPGSVNDDRESSK